MSNDIKKHHFCVTVNLYLTDSELAELKHRYQEFCQDYPGMYPTLEEFIPSALCTALLCDMRRES
jgi:hypothetical protein